MSYIDLDSVDFKTVMVGNGLFNDTIFRRNKKDCLLKIVILHSNFTAGPCVRVIVNPLRRLLRGCVRSGTGKFGKQDATGKQS